MIRLSLYIALALMLSACSRSVTPYKKVVGFIGEGCNDSVLVVIPSDGNGKKLLFNITDKTTYTKEHIIEGNIVEVGYVAPSTEVRYDASTITASATYARAIGRWESNNRKGMKIAIELLPGGVIRQSNPKGILHFLHWQLLPEEDELELIGEVDIPVEKAEAESDIDTKVTAKTPREPQHFRTRVTLTTDEESEQEMMLFHNDTTGNTILVKR